MVALFSAAAFSTNHHFGFTHVDGGGQFQALWLRFSCQKPLLGQALGKELQGGSVGPLNPLAGRLAGTPSTSWLDRTHP